MRSDFAALCAQARDDLSFAPAPLGEIRRRVALHRPARRAKQRWLVVAALVALPIAAAAAGAGLWRGAHLSYMKSGAMQLQFDRGAMKEHPTLADMRSAARNLGFRAVLPAGLPEGTVPVMLMRAGSSLLVLQYDLPGAWRRDDHLLGIILADPNALGAARVHVRTKYELVMGRRGGTHFRAGNEEVIVMGSSLRPQEVAKLRRATIAAAK